MFDLSRLEPPSKRTWALLGYSWLLSYAVGSAVGGALAETIVIIGELVPWPLLTGILGFILFNSLKFLAIGFFFVWLAEGKWVWRAALAWLVTKLLIPLIYAGSTRFALPLRMYLEAGAISLYWPGALDLAFCLFGARLAHDNEFRPGLRNAREVIFQMLILPR